MTRLVHARRVSLVAMLIVAGCAAMPPATQTTTGARQTKQARARTSEVACTQPGDCVLIEASCCGACTMPTLSDVVALRADRVATRDRSQCRDVGCPDCVTPTNPSLIATCRAGRCAAVDLQRAPVTRCTSSDTCVLAFARCCECGASRDSVVAIRQGMEGTLARAVCGPQPVACPECVGVMPRDLEAQCVAGRCVAQSRAD